jgi:aldehyde:ferredoxin oxidoreductase
MVWVDLDKGELKIEPTSEGYLKQFIGGRGLGIKLLTDLAPPGVDPLVPANPLIFTTGPYTGTGVFSAFFSVTTKAPLTGIALSSHCGGHWGPRLKKALTGIALTEAELTLAGERIWNLERLYNLGEGIESDMAAPRLFRENLDDGQAGGEAISEERFLYGGWELPWASWRPPSTGP